MSITAKTTAVGEMPTARDAYEIGIEAYIYFYPLVLMEITRRQTTNIEPGKRPGFGPMNSFSHMRAFPPADFKAVVRPNFDTLYSIAWLDLTREPMVVSVPDTQGRYYLLPMLDMWTDVFAVPGKRTSGTQEGNYAVVPPGWQGHLPAGVQAVQATTPYVWTIGRTQTNGPQDYPAVHRIQDGFRLIALAAWGKEPQPLSAVTVDPKIDMATPPLDQVNAMSATAYFSLAAELMTLHPPHSTDWSTLARLRRIGIAVGKRFDAATLDPMIAHALESIPADALKLMQEKLPTLARAVNGWQMNTDTMGVYGDYYLKRAMVAMIGLGANQPEDAIYPINIADAQGQPLTGDNNYVLHFAKDELPPVNAFWSLTMYDAAGFPAANPINRFALGDRDPLMYNPDGTLDLYLQHESPGTEKETNWLPAPRGPLGATMRLYAPQPQALDGRWNPPAITRVQQGPQGALHPGEVPIPAQSPTPPSPLASPTRTAPQTPFKTIQTLVDWHETYAYTLGLQAYTYGYPWIYFALVRWKWTTQPVNPEYVPYMPLNTFWHARHLMTAAYRDGGGPNNDTLYSAAWVDVGREPMILSHPDMGKRYFTFELASFTSDNFAYVGKRVTGPNAGHFALVCPNWKGTLPSGVTAVAPATTPQIFVLGRTLVDGEADLDTVHALQDQYRLTPLSLWGQLNAEAPLNRAVWQPFDSRTDPLADWKTMNRAMAENPPEARHALLLKQFATIGVGPGLDVEQMDAGTKRGLARVAAEGKLFFQSVWAQGGMQKRVNGWFYPPRTLGRAGEYDDFVTRGALQSATGLVANDPEEAVYLNVAVDGAGERLSGERRYRLHFAPGTLPPVNAFWSLTMYGMDMNLVDNPINRYSLGDRTPGLRRDADGGLTLSIQREQPAVAEQVANWLPAPTGLFNMVLRCYLPATEIVEQIWRPSALEVVE